MMVRQQILRAHKFGRNELLNKEKNSPSENKLVLNITYHPAYSRVKEVLTNIHVLLTHNEEHRNAFTHIPLVGFKRGKSLKDLLVREKLTKINKGIGASCKYGGNRCGVCQIINVTQTFSNKEGDRTYEIRSDTLDCNSENVVYLVQCKTCNMQYVGSASTKFRLRLNNYKYCLCKYEKQKSVPQMFFHTHFAQEGYNGMADWSFTLIDQGCNLNSVRRNVLAKSLNTFQPYGLNERDVTLNDFG